MNEGSAHRLGGIDLAGIKWFENGKPRGAALWIGAGGQVRLSTDLIREFGDYARDDEGFGRARIGMAPGVVIVQFVEADDARAYKLRRRVRGKATEHLTTCAPLKDALRYAGYTLPLRLAASVYPEQGLISARLPQPEGQRG